MEKEVKRIKEYTKSNIKIFLPLAVVAAGVILFTGHIPYVNQYAQEFMLVVLVVEWFIFKRLIPVSRTGELKIILALFVVSLMFSFVGVSTYSEVVGNFIYAILLMNVVPLLLNKQS